MGLTFEDMLCYNLKTSVVAGQLNLLPCRAHEEVL